LTILRRHIFLHRTASRALLTFAAAAVLMAAAAALAGPAAATKVIRDKTFTNFRLPEGAHDRVYERCTFTSTSSTRAVLQIDKAAHDITFRNCLIKSGKWNGISINDRHGNIHDITFYRCRIRPQRRMGFECTSRPTDATRGYHGIRIMGCTFDPQGSEAISFDGGPGCVNNRVSGTLIKGAGTNLDMPWGQAFELNGITRFRFVNNTIYQSRGSLLNLQMHTSVDCRWTFTGNRLDASVHKQKVRMSPTAQVVCGKGIHGGEFHDNTIIADKPGGGVAWFGDCHDMDWRGNRWRDSRRGSWDEPFLEMGSSGNLF
jgi:hypothetical protein